MNEPNDESLLELLKHSQERERVLHDMLKQTLRIARNAGDRADRALLTVCSSAGLNPRRRARLLPVPCKTMWSL